MCKVEGISQKVEEISQKVEGTSRKVEEICILHYRLYLPFKTSQSHSHAGTLYSVMHGLIFNEATLSGFVSVTQPQIE